VNNTKISEAYKIFFESLYSGGIKTIMEAAYKIFDCPVVVTDENYRLLCQIPSEPIGEPVWDELFYTQTLDKNIIWQYQKQYLNEQINTYKPFYADWGLVGEAPRIFGEIYNNNKILGHIGIFLMNKPFEDDDLEISQILINALSIEIQNKRRDFGSQLYLASTYFMDLIDNSTSTQLKIQSKEKLNRIIFEKYVLLVTPLGTRASIKAFSSYAITKLIHNYRDIIPIIYDNCIVTLIGNINPSEFDPNSNHLIKKIVSFFSEQNLVSAICDVFSDLSEIPSRYQQALLTAKIAIAKKSTHLGISKEYVPYQLFVEICSNYDTKIFIHPAIYEIIEYDRTHSTEYYNTLCAYSLSMHNNEATSKQLSIHRNTLLYRLNRIKELFDLPYENEQTSLHLLCSFLLSEAEKYNIVDKIAQHDPKEKLVFKKSNK
jgi:hypothetical protein